MNSIIVARSNDPGMSRRTMLDMYRFRHKVFHDRLGWEVNSRNGMEIDVFDKLEPFYIVAKDGHRRVEGCWRLLPTTGPYMLKDTFPQLLRGEAAPEVGNIWELSRFAVDSSEPGDLAQGNMRMLTFEMIRSVVDFAESRGIRHFVTVTSVAMERMMKQAGICFRRFGDGKAERVGKVLTVACWVDIDDRLHQAVDALPIDLTREAA